MDIINYNAGDLIRLKADCPENLLDSKTGFLPSFDEVVECREIYSDGDGTFVRFRYLDSDRIDNGWFAKRFELVEKPIDVTELLSLIQEAQYE